MKTFKEATKEVSVMGLKKAIRDVNKAIEKSKELTTKDREKLKSSTFCG